MSSRFFKHISDSDSESSESDEDIQGPRPAAPVVASYSFSDEEEEAKRVVRTTKEKRYEELHTIIKQIRNFKKIKDFSKMLTAFENLCKAYTKAKPIIDKEEGGTVPRFYVRCLVEISDIVEETWEDKEFKKNMNKNNSKSLTSLRQKLRKYTKDFESELAKYRESPDKEDAESGEDKSDDSEGSDDESASSDEEKPQPKASAASAFLKTKGGDDDDDESEDSDDWGSSDESSLSSDDDKYGENLAQKFLKREKDDDKDRKDKKREKKDRIDRKIRKTEEPEDEAGGEGGWTRVDGGTVYPERPRLFAKDEEVDHNAMLKKVLEILAMRGKKRIHRSDQIHMLNELLEISAQHKLGPAMEVKLLFAILGALLSYSTSSSSMRPYSWKQTLMYFGRMLDVIVANSDNLCVGEKIAEDSESFSVAPYRISGCPLTLIERIDDEFTRVLQSVDAHSPDYIERLKDEKSVCELIDRLANYLEENGRGSSFELCRVYILKIDHLYYKFDPDETAQKENLALMDRLCKYIYANDKTDRLRTQAILYHIYHHALHDNLFEARDLMLMSHLQHNIVKADIPLHVIYNRALVQLGLCAFRHGNIKDAHTALLDIQIMGRAKELLAQGLLPRLERTAEQEKVEKRRLLPFHKHINLELLECVYLVSAMLLEIPDVAANEFSIRKKMISRSFYNQLRKNEEQPLVGLPESMREHVVAASKAMRVGNWVTCVEFIVNEKMNNKVWNLFHRPDRVREMLVRKIREESLRSYLFTYSHVYDSISLDVLSKMFDLEKATVHSIVSKMMTNEELMASLDEPTQSLVMHRTEPSRIQGLCLQLTDKINTLVEHNEKLWEVKQQGVFGQRIDRFDRKDGEFGGGRGRWGDRSNYENRQRGGDGRRGSRFDGRRDKHNRDE